MTSILTNNGAMVALQTLQSINNNLTDTQNAISTGKEINSAQDNSAIWAISKVMESDVAGFNAIGDSLSLGESTVKVALAGIDQISNILNDIKEKVVAATGENVDHTKIGNEITELADQVAQIVDASQFNGANLLKDDIDGAGTTALTVLSSLDRSGTTVTAANITVTGIDLTTASMDLAGDIDVSSASAADASLANIETHIQTVLNAGAALGAGASRIADQKEFVGKLADAMKSGIGSLVDTNMEEASAKLKALQTQQQLGVQALSIANSAPSTLQQLFR